MLENKNSIVLVLKGAIKLVRKQSGLKSTLYEQNEKQSVNHEVL